MKTYKRILAVILCVVLTITAAPLTGLVSLFAPEAQAKDISGYAVGDIIEFGSYPQSEVTDQNLKTELLSHLYTKIAAGESQGFVSYGYYSGTGDYDDGQMKPGDFMKYADVEYEGKKYRGVMINSYRPYYTVHTCSANYSYQDDNGYTTGNIYWFEYEPLEWRVLDPAEGFILCESVIDAQAYSNVLYYNSSASNDSRYYYFNSTSCTNYASDYETSSIRAWLNEVFYNTAFTSAEKAQIGTTTLDNSCYSSSYPQLDSAATRDKIFLLSYDEARNTSYGFSSSTGYSSTRYAYPTAYAKAQGVYVYSSYNTANWWLRTPGSNSYNACGVTCHGNVYYADVYIDYYGIRPALKFNLDSEIYKSKNYTTYAVKAVDETTGKPLSGVHVVFDGESVGSTDYTGVYNLKVGSDVDITKTVTFNRNDYTNETRALYELNQYSTSTVSMKSGFDMSNMLTSVAFNNEEVHGPKIEILGEEFYLFKTNVNLNLGPLSVKYKQDEKEKTVKYIVGLKEGVDVENYDDFNDNYYKMKDFFMSFSGDGAYNRYCKYQQMKGLLAKNGGDCGFSADLSVAGYIEFDYSSGDMVYKEGGLVVTAEVSVSQDVPFAYICYATFKVGGEIEGKLYFQQDSSGEVMPGGSFGLKLKPSIGVGAKLISKNVASVEAGINGSIGGKVTLPASALREALSLDLSAGVYVKAKALWVFENEWSKTVNMNLYPNFGDIEINSTDSIVEIDRNDFKPLSRDYLNTVKIETQSIDETINNYSVYPYADPQLVELDDGRIVALWLGDNGTKSTMNLTTLYYSVYENGTWSVPAAVYESGLADNEPKICTDGEKVYVLWQRGNEVFSDDASLDYMLENTDLVYSEFDGEWTEPVLVGNSGSGMYPISHNIATDNGNVAITWAEETESSMNVYTQQLVNGTWGTVNKAATLDNISSLAIGYVDGVATVAYSTDLDGNTETTGDSEVYIGSSRLTNDTVDDYGVTYQNGEFYYISGGYLANNNTVTNLYVGGNYSVLNNGTTTAVVYPVADGYKSELYVAYKEADGYSIPVALTSTGEHIADYSAIIDSENTIVAAMAVRNIDENATGYPYTSTDFIIDNIGQLADLEMSDIVYFDTDSVAAGNPVTFAATFKNIGTAAVNGYTLNLKDSSGTLVAAREYEASVASGETVEADVIYTLPGNFKKQTYTVEVVSNDDSNEKNNTATVEIGHADIEVVSCEITDGKIVATVTNNGYETVTDAKADISRFTTESTLLGTVAIDVLEPGEVETVEYILPASQLLFDTPYSSNRFIVEVTIDTEEISSVNNTAEVLYSPKAVEAIDLNTSEVVMGVNTNYQLLATVTPYDAYNQTVHWVSDSTNVVEVDEYTGELAAISCGTAIITAITDDGDYVASCFVRVVGMSSSGSAIVNNTDKLLYGLDAGIESLDNYVTVSDEDCVLEYEPTQNGFGTGTRAMLIVNGEIVDSYTVVIFGDVNGDGWYDGEDAFLVNLIAKGMLSKDDVGEAIWTAADCNHDGVIDELDVDLLSGAGLKLNDVDQTKTAAELATNADYIEYVMLIDQSAGFNVEPDTDETEQSSTTPETNETVESDEPVTEDHMDFEIIFTNIFEFIKKILSLIFSFII